MDISEIRELWGKEKEFYKKSEVGSGVQRFAWEVLQSPNFFNLSKGLKSTPHGERSNEFLLEESNKLGLADAVIFIDAEIIIPVEVERLERAQSGEWQILKYRTAFDKKYGILTDGREWRFYYGRIDENKYRTFAIEDMLDEPDRFCHFWEEYTKPQNYYLSYFDEEAVTDSKKTNLTVDHNRAKFFEEVTGIIQKLKNKLLNAGYFQSITDKRERDKKATETAYSYLIQFILYKTLVDNSFPEYQNEYEKRMELIHVNLKRESYVPILGILEGISSKISENIYKPFHEEQVYIFDQVKKIIHSGEDDLLSVAPFLDILVFVRKFDFSNVQNDIFGVIYENYLKELYEEQNFGQYFTDPAVVNVMLRELGYSSSELKSRDHKAISIVDPSCGSGTFLYSAVREIVLSRDDSSELGARAIEKDVLENVFGLDIAEFPLYLAEMSILMKLLPVVINQKYNNPIDKKLKLFVTEDSLAEFEGEIGGRVRAGTLEQVKLALTWRYDGFMRDNRDLDEMKQSLNTRGGGAKTVSRQRFDFVIGNPPYIGYNQSAKMGLKYFRLLKDKDASPSLNNVYGWNLHSVPGNAKSYRPNPNLYAFFVALGFGLLKEGGKFCYIIPQTLLNAGDLDVVRYHLANDYTIEKIITFEGNLFIGRGTNHKKRIATSSLILVCTKKSPLKTHTVECIQVSDTQMDVKQIASYIHDRSKSSRKLVSQKKLRSDLQNWNFIKWSASFQAIYDTYVQNSTAIQEYYDHKEAQKKYGSQFYFDGGYSIDERLMLESQENEEDYMIPKISDGQLVPQGYWPNNRNPATANFIGLRQGNQGYNFLDAPYKVIWSYANPKGIFFTDQRFIWPRNKYCGIGTDNYNESLYLYGLLCSRITWQVLRALLATENEKSLLLSLSSIKSFIRIPVITDKNQHLKDKLIHIVKELLALQKTTIGEIIAIDSPMQRFDTAIVNGNKLSLIYGTSTYECPIKKGHQTHLKLALELYNEKNKQSSGSVNELKATRLYGEEDIRHKKSLLDDLVDELYNVS